MPKIKLNDLDYGGSPTVEDADHLMVADTRNQTLSAQNIITNILGDMAQLEHNATASKAYAKGEYLVLGSYFYKVTDDIAQGDTLVAGTNIEQTNVGAEVSELNSKIKKKTIAGTTNNMGYGLINIAYNDYEIVSIVSQSSGGYVTMYGRYGNDYVLYLVGTNGNEVLRLYADTDFRVGVYYCERGAIPLISN